MLPVIDLERIPDDPASPVARVSIAGLAVPRSHADVARTHYADLVESGPRGSRD